MKNNIILTILFSFLFFQIYAKMSEEKREYLLNKLTKKFSMENADKIREMKEKLYTRNLKETITYDPLKIEEILNKYGFPLNYNFIEETNATAKVKNQGKCGCCWSHAATTALSYRYHKIGTEVDLSPQDALSCYLKDCDSGNYLIDPEMNLIKNGTVTEECLPFNSGDGIIKDECPTTCKDGSTPKKYYARNAYMTQDYYSNETFYEIVALMMDQLINKGPIVTAIDVYYDFQMLHYDQEKCANEVYTYDGESEYLGGHAVAVVGYGYMNSKYYWLLQNSWGESACDKGFVKVEFGQIGVEQVAFVEPYSREHIITVPVSTKIDSLDGECTMKISNSGIFSWRDTLDIGFKNTETNNPFNFQCNKVSLIDGKKNVCYFEIFKIFSQKGTYKYSYHQSLGEDNSFNLDYSSVNQFSFYGLDDYMPIFSNYLFISQEGSKIMLLYSNNGGDDRYISPIFANINSVKALSDCNYFALDGNEYVYCNIKQDEVDYFDNYTSISNPLAYNVLCGVKEEIGVFVLKLDTTKYPIFRVKSLLLPLENKISSKSTLTIISDIEGSLSAFKSEQVNFYSFIDVEVMEMNLTGIIKCQINNPKNIMKDFSFKCNLDIEDGSELPYDNIYLHPLNMPAQVQYPYEVFIKEKIKGEKIDPTSLVPKIQVYIESLCPDCVNFITNSFKDFYEKVKRPNLADIEFIPYGNAKEVYNSTTKKYDFTCQHGENECYGNLIETCAIQILGKIQSYTTILCIESNIAKYQKDFDKTLEFCLSNDQTSLQQVKDCVKSDMGNYYEHQMALKTDSNHKWVPWIVVNGIHDEKVENQIIDNLIDFVCGDDKTKCYLE